MVVFDDIEEIFQNCRSFNEYSRASITLATVVGVLVVIFIFLKSVHVLSKLLRLYVFSQIFKVDYVKRYGKWALVTGSTDGIGLAMAKELASRGHSIILVGRNEEKLAKCKSSIEADPNVGDVETIKIDLSDSSVENYERAWESIDFESKDIGILINNAGTLVGEVGPLTGFDHNQILQVVNVNSLATVFFTKMILPGMLARKKGLIVNISSIAGSFTSPHLGVYGPSKTFLKSFTAQIQHEYGRSIDIIYASPGMIRTNLFNQYPAAPESMPFIPTSDEFAKTFINALSTRISAFTGCFNHAISHAFAVIMDLFGLYPSFLDCLLESAKNRKLKQLSQHGSGTQAGAKTS